MQINVIKYINRHIFDGYSDECDMRFFFSFRLGVKLAPQIYQTEYLCTYIISFCINSEYVPKSGAHYREISEVDMMS